jgi:hypothetical protein
MKPCGLLHLATAFGGPGCAGVAGWSPSGGRVARPPLSPKRSGAQPFGRSSPPSCELSAVGAVVTSPGRSGRAW